MSLFAKPGFGPKKDLSSYLRFQFMFKGFPGPCYAQGPSGRLAIYMMMTESEITIVPGSGLWDVYLGNSEGRGGFVSGLTNFGNVYFEQDRPQPGPHGTYDPNTYELKARFNASWSDGGAIKVPWKMTLSGTLHGQGSAIVATDLVLLGKKAPPGPPPAAALFERIRCCIPPPKIGLFATCPFDPRFAGPELQSLGNAFARPAAAARRGKRK